jgi:hypothetical protein
LAPDRTHPVACLLLEVRWLRHRPAFLANLHRGSGNLFETLNKSLGDLRLFIDEVLSL